jgi:hypothetical protein
MRAVSTAAKQSHKAPSVRRAKPVVEVSGFVLVSLNGKKKAQPATLKRDERTGALLRRIGAALDKPGIVERTTRPGAYTYAVYPADPTKVVQKAADGTSRVGRLARGRFTPIKQVG